MKLPILLLSLTLALASPLAVAKTDKLEPPQRVLFVDVSSENLNYKERRGQACIHPKYHQWIANLAQDISARVASL